jgi:hypothetical protein
MTGRAIPMAQLSGVMIWNSVKALSPSVPNHCGKSEPKSPVAMTAAT